MPLFSEDELLGGIYADLREEAGYFRQPELDFVVAFAPAAAHVVLKSSDCKQTFVLDSQSTRPSFAPLKLETATVVVAM